MVATFVEIVVGVRLTDREVCKMFLGMSDEEYDKKLKEMEGISVLSGFCFVHKKLLLNGWKIFQCVCCSDTTDVIVGYSIKKMYRIKDKKKCKACDKWSFCNQCFSTTDEGVIDFDKTYSFKYELSPFEVCRNCSAYNKNGKEEEQCINCQQPLKRAKKETILGREAKLYFHWDDCSSCT